MNLKEFFKPTKGKIGLTALIILSGILGVTFSVTIPGGLPPIYSYFFVLPLYPFVLFSMIISPIYTFIFSFPSDLNKIRYLLITIISTITFFLYIPYSYLLASILFQIRKTIKTKLKRPMQIIAYLVIIVLLILATLIPYFTAVKQKEQGDKSISTYIADGMCVKYDDKVECERIGPLTVGRWDNYFCHWDEERNRCAVIR